MEIAKKPNENEEQYLWRLGQAKDNGLIDYDWSDIAAIMNKEFREEDNYYEASAYRKPYQYAKKFFEKGVFDDLDKPKYISEMENAKLEIQIEIKKIQTEKIELNRRLREEARDEMILDEITKAIKTLPQIQFPTPILSQDNTDKEFVLVFGDAHYGIEFTLFDLLGKEINSYSPEIFKKRMNLLLDEVKKIVNKEHITKLNIFEMGDGIQGIIRLNSQLMKLRYGIIDSAVRYADYLANWLNELTKVIKVDFYMVEDSNHNQLRICGATKNAFSEENMSKVMATIIDLRLKGNPNFKMVKNSTGMIYAELCGYTLLGIHGEVSNLATSINEFSRAYNKNIDYLLAGHCHHRTQKEVGINSEVITTGSIIGVDPYGLSPNKVANSSALLLVFEPKNGKTCEYTIKLE